MPRRCRSSLKEVGATPPFGIRPLLPALLLAAGDEFRGSGHLLLALLAAAVDVTTGSERSHGQHGSGESSDQTNTLLAHGKNPFSRRYLFIGFRKVMVKTKRKGINNLLYLILCIDKRNIIIYNLNSLQ